MAWLPLAARGGAVENKNSKNYSSYMRIHEIQDALRKQPFEPFRVHLTDGQKYDVRHPEFAAVTRTSMFIGMETGPDEVPDRMLQRDLLHVVALEPINGRGAPHKS